MGGFTGAENFTVYTSASEASRKFLDFSYYYLFNELAIRLDFSYYYLFNELAIRSGVLLAQEYTRADVQLLPASEAKRKFLDFSYYYLFNERAICVNCCLFRNIPGQMYYRCCRAKRGGNFLGFSYDLFHELAIRSEL
jgi:hypothetical protein